MSKIRIKNFGPIKNGYQENEGWMHIKKVTVFIGNQGSGKSTVAKLISTFTWIEKALNRGDLTIKQLTTTRLLSLLKYQRINNYYDNNKTEIEYEGDQFYIGYKFSSQFVVTRKIDGKLYTPPQVVYIPAERNFLSSVSEAFNVKGMPETLFTFAEELRKAQRNLEGATIELPINNFKYQYDQEKDISYVIGKDHQVNLLEASSGFQSTIPLFLVTRYLAYILMNDKFINENISVDNVIRMSQELIKVYESPTLPQLEKDKQVVIIKNKFINKCLINIVEEPEQNLFPSSQRQMLNELLKFNNMKSANKLIMTTHSPYLINYLTLAVEANKLKPRVNKEELKSKLDEIVPLNSTLDGNDLVVYQLDEKNGTIEKLKEYKGLPSDENYLNEGLAESNDEFSKLLDLEDLCQ